MAAVIWSLGPVATYVAGVVLVNFTKPLRLINWPLESRSIWMLALTGVPLELWTVTVEKGATVVLSFTCWPDLVPDRVGALVKEKTSTFALVFVAPPL